MFERTITLDAWQKCQGWCDRRRVSHTFSRARARFPRNTGDDSHRLERSKAWDEPVPGSSGPICFGSRRSVLEKSWNAARLFFLVLSTRELPTGHRFPERSRADRGTHCFPWSWESKRLQGKQIPRSTRRPEPRSWSNALPIYPLRAFLARSTLPLRFLHGKHYNNGHIYFRPCILINLISLLLLKFIWKYYIF